MPRAARGQTWRPARHATRPRRGRRSPPRSRARSRGPARPRGPRRRARAALERLEDPRRLVGRNSRPVVDDAHEHLRSDLPHLDADRLLGRRVAQRVLDEVCEDGTGLVEIGMHERQVFVGQDHLDAAARLDAVEHLQDEVVDRPVARLRSSRPRLQAREVEQVADDAVEPLGLAEDRLGELAAVLGRERELAVGESAGRREDRHQRRAQVMADRAQHRRLHRVAAPQRLGLERLLREPLPLGGHLSQRLESRLGLFGAPPRAGCELADHDGRDEEDEQREPVARVLQGQRVERRQEEEVEGEHAPERRPDAVCESPRDGDRDDREQVEHGEAEDGHVALQQLDCARDERERGGRGRDPGERSHPGNGTPWPERAASRESRRGAG